MHISQIMHLWIAMIVMVPFQRGSLWSETCLSSKGFSPGYVQDKDPVTVVPAAQ